MALVPIFLLAAPYLVRLAPLAKLPIFLVGLLNAKNEGIPVIVRHLIDGRAVQYDGISDHGRYARPVHSAEPGW